MHLERSAYMNTGVNYKLFYEILLNLRESFHSYGRIDDSNSKLDEIVKLILLSYYKAKQGEKFTLELVKKYANEHYLDSSQVALALRSMFDEAVQYPLYRNADGTSIFGANPSLNIQPTENLFAERLISEIEKIDFVNLVAEDNATNFDIINECFGHFVRENFRNNKEDAQYMTPAEITMPIISMIFNDFLSEGYFNDFDLSDFKIMDPTCGVGTLLIESARKYIDLIEEGVLPTKKKEQTIANFLNCGILGQDKVDRMVRLSKINTLLMGANCNNISIGNSIADTSSIDQWHGKIDLIFTNPPFGAEYSKIKLNTEHFSHLDTLTVETSISSELLMLLKCLSLLKENGKLVIVLPDSVFSARGINDPVRKIILEYFTVNAIIEMPAVTFAQAGTRTKTSVLYLTKKKRVAEQQIIMAVCENIGYNVKERMGVPVKIVCGENDVERISEIYRSAESFNEMILSTNPSVTVVSTSDLIDNILNPSFYSANRLDVLSNLESKTMRGFELRSLSDIVRFETIGRKNKNVSDDTKHISVLHINPDCTIDFQQVLSFEPISKGRQCFEGDILFSKINPRIPRMTVVPSFEKDLVCSNEFEILKPCSDVGAFAICFLLKTSYVMKQIEHLTSGTSSSHSRIKREQLATIKIPYPVSIVAKQKIKQINDLIGSAFNAKYDADTVLRSQLSELESL